MESGLNDGLALPFVLIFLALAKHESSHISEVLLELVLGLVIGVGVAALVALAWRSKILTASSRGYSRWDRWPSPSWCTRLAI